MASFTVTFVPPSLITDEFCPSSSPSSSSSSLATCGTPYPRFCYFKSSKTTPGSRSQTIVARSPAFNLAPPLARRKVREIGVGARAFAMEVTEETGAPSWRDGATLRNAASSAFLADSQRKQQGEFLSLPRPPRNTADDPSLRNPLLRLHRMGCGWLGVIVEWDGVIVEDEIKLERESWMALAQEEGRSPPPGFVLRKAEGMKSEQVISELLCWSRDVKETRRLAQRREEILQELHGGAYQLKLGSHEFVLTLQKYNIPVALASTRPRRVIEKAVENLGLKGNFSAIVTAEDVYRGKPDPEIYMYAAQLLDVIPERCIVIGNSNTSVEAAHDTFMKCIAVAGKHPFYELGAADLVITRLDNLSLVDLKNLADLDSPEFQPPEPQPELEPEEEALPQTRVALSDRW